MKRKKCVQTDIWEGPWVTLIPIDKLSRAVITNYWATLGWKCGGTRVSRFL